MLRALGLGDLLTAVPPLRGLAAAFPHHRRVLATPAALEPLVRLTATVDEVVDASPLVPLDGSLTGVDVAVNLHGRGPDSHRILLDTAPRRLIAFAHPEVPQSAAGPPWYATEHEVLRWCRLLQASGIPADPTRLDLPAPPVSKECRVATDLAHSPAATTVIHPGAASVARRWPPERWAAVARHETGRGRAVVITGGPEERQLAAHVGRMARLPESAVLAGSTDVMGLASVVAAAGLVVCGDTGVAHLATALGTPSVVLFGPVPPSQWGPPPDRERHIALWAGRLGDPHGTEADPGLLRITVDDVCAALAQAEPITSTMRST
ncbi:MAG TPA: glycosyltransferase family 9 protein [Acidimicrobiales bacterium]|nr:glycosyltransferase family 9 protein [Acidimicrobiales bacterium]